MQVSLQFDDFFWTKIFRNSNFNFNDPDYETFFGFYETRDRKGFLLGCSQSNFGVIPKGDKSDG